MVKHMDHIKQKSEDKLLGNGTLLKNIAKLLRNYWQILMMSLPMTHYVLRNSLNNSYQLSEKKDQFEVIIYVEQMVVNAIWNFLAKKIVINIILILDVITVRNV